MRGISTVTSLGCRLVSAALVSVVSVSGLPGQSLTLRLENDIGFGDAGYTNGVRADLVTYMHNSTLLRWSIGQAMFTPKEIEADTLIPDDRPYGGWFYLGAAATFGTRAMEANKIRTSVGIELGLTGPSSLAGDLQRWWHSQFNRPKPSGWQYQVPDRFGFVLTADVERTVPDIPAGDMDLNGQLHAGLKMGNIANAVYYGVPFRFGWNPPASAPTPIINSTFAGSPPARPKGRWALYLSAMVESSFVFYDYLVDGSERHDVESTRARVDLALGIGARIGRLSGSWHLIATSPDFHPNGQWESFQAYSVTIDF